MSEYSWLLAKISLNGKKNKKNFALWYRVRFVHPILIGEGIVSLTSCLSAACLLIHVMRFVGLMLLNLLGTCYSSPEIRKKLLERPIGARALQGATAPQCARLHFLLKPRSQVELEVKAPWSLLSSQCLQQNNKEQLRITSKKPCMTTVWSEIGIFIGDDLPQASVLQTQSKMPP